MCTADMRPPTSLRCCAPAAKAYLQQLRQAERAEGSGSEDETTHDAVAQRLRADALEVPIWFPNLVPSILQHCRHAEHAHVWWPKVSLCLCVDQECC